MTEKLKEVLFESMEDKKKNIKMNLNLNDLPIVIKFENRREYLLNHTTGGGLILTKRLTDD